MTTYFVSGHLDLTQEEFEAHYAPYLREAAKAGASFVVGDAPGCDEMAQRFLYTCVIPADRVTVYHMLQAPRRHVAPWPTRGGFTSDEARDSAMTAASDDDIAWVRPAPHDTRPHRGGSGRGTKANLQRRKDVRRERDREARKHYPRFIVTDDYAEYPVTRIEQEPVTLGQDDSGDWERAIPLPPDLAKRIAAAREQLAAAHREWEACEQAVRLWRSRQENDPV